MSEPLRARALTVVRGGRRLLDSVDLTLRPGTLTAVVGPNGAGKSTLLRVLTGDWAPDSGRVELLGRPLDAWTARGLARVRAVLPQSSELSFGFAVEDIVAMGRSPWDEPQRATQARVAAEIRSAGLEDLVGRSFTTLSGGERQRVQLARVLAQLPEEGGILFLDEPTNHLDLTFQIRLLQGVRRRVERGCTAFAILHDLSLAARVADQVLVLQHGRVRAVGPPQQALAPAVLEPVFGLALDQVPLADRGFVLVPRF